MEDTFSNNLMAKGEGIPQSEARTGRGPEKLGNRRQTILALREGHTQGKWQRVELAVG